MRLTDLTKAVRDTVGTPFHHGGRIPGVGLDCGGILVAALVSLGVSVFDKPYYSRSDGISDMVEVLKTNDFIQREGVEGVKLVWEDVKPGDVVLIRSSTMYHHLVYVTENHTIIHAWFTTGINRVVESTILPEWKENIHSIWRYANLEVG